MSSGRRVREGFAKDAKKTKARKISNVFFCGLREIFATSASGFRSRFRSPVRTCSN